jgi:hypothetical protein
MIPRRPSTYYDGTLRLAVAISIEHRFNITSKIVPQDIILVSLVAPTFAETVYHDNT